MFPVFVIALHGQIKIKTTRRGSKGTMKKARIDLLFILNSTWPSQRRTHHTIKDDKDPMVRRKDSEGLS